MRLMEKNGADGEGRMIEREGVMRNKGMMEGRGL